MGCRRGKYAGVRMNTGRRKKRLDETGGGFGESKLFKTQMFAFLPR